MRAVEIAPVEPVIAAAGELAAMPVRRAAVEIAPARHREIALGVTRGARDDVDHAVHRVGTPLRATGPADDLDTLDILHHHILRFPEHAGEERRVDGPPVDQHEHFVREHAVGAARRDRPLVIVRARDLQVRRQPQRLGYAVGARAADVVRVDHIDGCRRIGQSLGVARHRGDLDIAELLERKIDESGRVQFGGARGGQHQHAAAGEHRRQPRNRSAPAARQSNQPLIYSLFSARRSRRRAPALSSRQTCAA